jgi:hypothetical protein
MVHSKRGMHPTVRSALLGALGAVGGTLEAGSGAILMTGGTAASATGIGAAPGVPVAIGGGILFAHGADTASAGLTQLFTGRSTSTLTNRGLQALGATPRQAAIAEMGLGLTSGMAPLAMGASAVRSGGVVAAESVSSPSVLARLEQGGIRYPGVDRFRDITLKPGTSVFVGEPGVSGFATTRGAFSRTGTDAQRIFEGLQVAPFNGTYRPGLTEYVITQETPAAFSIVRANTQYGSGGLPQLYIPNFSEVTRPVVGYPLTNTVTRIPK